MKSIIKSVISVVAIALFLFLLFVAITRAQQARSIATAGQVMLEKPDGADICGRVTSVDGRGIRRVGLVLTSSSGDMWTAFTGLAGFYCFNDIPAGDSYMLTIRAKRFTFDPSAEIILLDEGSSDVNFVAMP